MKDDILIDVSRETIVLLQRLGLLVEKWNKSINLISKKTVPEIWNRHILDSAQIFYANNKKHFFLEKRNMVDPSVILKKSELIDNDKCYVFSKNHTRPTKVFFG